MEAHHTVVFGDGDAVKAENKVTNSSPNLTPSLLLWKAGGGGADASGGCGESCSGTWPLWSEVSKYHNNKTIEKSNT